MTTTEQIQQIAETFGVTAEVVTYRDLFAAWDAEQRLADDELGEAPFETRRDVGV